MVDGPRVYRASAMGYSLEQLVAGHLGYEPIPPPEWLQKKFDEGTELEPVVLAELEARDWHLTTTQREVNSEGNHQIEVSFEVIPEVAIVRGHLDAIGRYIYSGDDSDRVVEVKSMADQSFQTFCRLGWDTPGLIQKYKWQVSAYMLATGMGVALVACNKKLDDDGLLELRSIYADEPFHTISDFALKLSAAEDYINKGIVPEGCTDYPCSFFYLHAPVDDPTPAPAELDGLLNAWKEANARKKAAEGEEKALRELVVEHMGEIAAKVKGSQGVTVSTSWVEEKEVSYVKKGHWETRITSPREKKGGSGIVASDG